MRSPHRARVRYLPIGTAGAGSVFLLDTPVLLELRGARSPGSEPRLVAWAGAVPRERLFVSAVHVAEVEDIAARAPDAAAGAALREWIDTRLLPAFDGHVLPVDTAVARRRRTLGTLGTRNALVAATAIEHGLTLVTRDRSAYRGARVRLLDPAVQPAETMPPTEPEPQHWRSAGQARPVWLRNLFMRG